MVLTVECEVAVTIAVVLLVAVVLVFRSLGMKVSTYNIIQNLHSFRNVSFCQSLENKKEETFVLKIRSE